MAMHKRSLKDAFVVQNFCHEHLVYKLYTFPVLKVILFMVTLGLKIVCLTVDMNSR